MNRGDESKNVIIDNLQPDCCVQWHVAVRPSVSHAMPFTENGQKLGIKFTKLVHFDLP